MREVYCQYLKKNAKGMDFVQYPGELGQKIYENISQEAWSLWIKKQTMLVNENKLSMLNTKDQEFLADAMERFLFKGEDIKVEGFVEPEK